jgi:hypothetical protein
LFKGSEACKNAVLKIIAPKKQSIFLERKHRPKKLKGTMFPHKGRALKQEQHITQSYYSCKKKKQFLDGSKNKKSRAQKILFKHQGKKYIEKVPSTARKFKTVSCPVEEKNDRR